MPRITSRVWVAVLSGVSLGLALFAETAVSGQVAAIGQARDGQPPPPPTVRRIPIGTSAISGTVTAADTGRPIRGARVTVNGTPARPAPPGVRARGGPPPVAGGGLGAVVPVCARRWGGALGVAVRLRGDRSVAHGPDRRFRSVLVPATAGGAIHPHDLSEPVPAVDLRTKAAGRSGHYHSAREKASR